MGFFCDLQPFPHTNTTGEFQKRVAVARAIRRPGLMATTLIVYCPVRGRAGGETAAAVKS